MKHPNLNEEKKLWKAGFKNVAGVDEAGRGPLAGPVVAAAVIIKNSKHEIRNLKQIQNSKVSKFEVRILDLKLRDSKQLTEKQRESIYEKLVRCKDVVWGIGVVSEKVIDKINILQATKLAMQKAINSVCVKFYDRGNLCALDFLLIDGNFEIKKIKIPQKSIIKGDAKVFSIAAASIIAKVTRDRLMKKYHKKYPEYNFLENKGYGTKAHFASLEKFGACKIHRKTFYPVSKL